MNEANASKSISSFPIEGTRSKYTGETSEINGDGGSAPLDLNTEVKRFRQAFKEDNTALRAH